MSVRITTTIKMSKMRQIKGERNLCYIEESVELSYIKKGEIFIKMNKNKHDYISIREKIAHNLPKGIRNWYYKQVNDGMILGIEGINHSSSDFIETYILLEKLKKSIKPILQQEGLKRCKICLYLHINIDEDIQGIEDMSDDELEEILREIKLCQSEEPLLETPYVIRRAKSTREQP